MKIYFLSSRPCALRLNGAYFGITDKFERFAEIALQDNIFAEFIPTDGLPSCCFLNEQLRFQPPDGFEVYILKNALALYAQDFPPKDCALRPILQQRNGDLLVTLFSQGKLHMSVQTPSDFHTAVLPDELRESELSFHGELIFLCSPTHIAVYDKTARPLLFERALSHSIENNRLSATLPLSDRLQRFANCVWELTDTDCKRTEFTIRQQTEQTDAPLDLLAYAFFESVLIGAPYEDMLCEELRPKASDLRAFLGDFISVTLTDEPTTCALIKKRGERLFEGAYYTVKIENGKITDITT